ncbi:MAG: LPS assembly lipoprotein LptE [Gemmatimonadaceae bacterium]
MRPTNRASGASASLVAILPLAVVLLLLNGCIYGFTGGGLPSDLRTVAVLPFDNETSSPDLQRELFEEMRREVEGRLGLRPAAEGDADVIVRGRIARYEPDIPVGYSADPDQANTARRRLQVSIDVEIFDQVRGRPLWTRNGLSAESEYAERNEETGRRLAVEKIVSDVIAGAQSQW